ncbi:hypothetical protein DV515_00004911 [Chloebia gouldiae]|uniref:Uncharacterized protein n=1 Tax=Chloebia gouldiae TaxID=44316 RepID=A0A3L8SQB6_CHLGU|nr:hypothetical protein DV515_00004911 [Chloebia gouldiae]
MYRGVRGSEGKPDRGGKIAPCAGPRGQCAPSGPRRGRARRPRSPAKAAWLPHRGARLQPLAPPGRTKWKRQTAVGLELLAEAGNYSALQRMFPSPYFYHPSLLGSMDSTTAAAAAAAMYSSMYRTPPAPHPQLQRPLVPRVLIHGLGPGGQPALNPLANPMPGTPHPR